MSKKTAEPNKKYYILVETDREGIRQFRSAHASGKTGVSLDRMYVEGKKVPALRLEVDEDTHYSYGREEWRQESRIKAECRCLISGENGRCRLCPLRVPNPDYTGKPGELKTLRIDCASCPHPDSVRGKKTERRVVHFSELSRPDSDGTINEWEPESPSANIYADEYSDLLSGFITYIRDHYPAYSKAPELLSLLGEGYTAAEASEIAGLPKSTLYWLLKKIRPLYDEYRDTIIEP